MGFLDLFFGSSTRSNRELRAQMRALREPKSKYYRLVQAVSWTLIGVAVVLLLLSMIPMITVLHDHQSVVLKGSLVVIAIGVGAQAALPWINFIERNRRLKDNGQEVPNWYLPLAIVFCSVIGVCIILWIIAVFIVHIETFARLIEKTGTAVTGEEGSIQKGDGALVFLAFSVVLSVQVFVATWIVTSVLYYKKKHMTIRVISYVCGVLTDIWGSWVLAGFLTGHLFDADGALMIPLNPSKLVLIIGILAVVGLLISNTFRANFVYRERLKAVMQGQTSALASTDEDFLNNTGERMPQGDVTAPRAPAREETRAPAQGKSTAEKLQELKTMYENGILTEEEYTKKRQEIIDKM